jgi:hypothetical protein
MAEQRLTKTTMYANLLRKDDEKVFEVKIPSLDTPVPTQMRFNRLMLWMADPNNKYQWNREAFQSYLKSISMIFIDFLRGCDTVRSQSGMSGTMRPEHVDTYCGSHPEILKRFAAIEPCLTH